MAAASSSSILNEKKGSPPSPLAAQIRSRASAAIEPLPSKRVSNEMTRDERIEKVRLKKKERFEKAKWMQIPVDGSKRGMTDFGGLIIKQRQLLADDPSQVDLTTIEDKDGLMSRLWDFVAGGPAAPGTPGYVPSHINSNTLKMLKHLLNYQLL